MDDSPFQSGGRGARRRSPSEGLLSDSEHDLLPRCRRGDEAAWRELVALHTRRVFALAYRFAGRADEAEDLTQEVFVKVYQTLDRYREGEGSFNAWIMAVARNHAIDHYRRRRSDALRKAEEPEVLDRMASDDEGALRSLETQERVRLVHRGLQALPEELRVPLILCDLQGLPYAEIAQALQIPLGTVKTRLRSALIKIRKANELKEPS